MDIQILSAKGLMLCGAFFLAGLFDSVCGGGGLITMPAFLTIGFPAGAIVSTTQCSVTLGSFTALGRYLKSGKVHWKSALLTAPFAAAGGLLGAELNMVVPADVLEIIMIVLIPVITVLMIVKKDFGGSMRVNELSRGRLIFGAVFIGLVIGMYHGFYGTGAGMFYMMCFALLLKLDLVTASGNTKVVVIFANLAAVITYALGGAIVWKLVAILSIFNIGGNYLGAALAVRKGAKVIRPMFFAVLGLMLLRLVYTLIRSFL